MPDHIFDVLVGALLAVVSAVQLNIWKEILSLRRSRHHHANVLQRYAGRFARIGDELNIRWDDFESDITP